MGNTSIQIKFSIISFSTLIDGLGSLCFALMHETIEPFNVDAFEFDKGVLSKFWIMSDHLKIFR
jgi:hypothetical protein